LGALARSAVVPQVGVPAVRELLAASLLRIPLVVHAAVATAAATASSSIATALAGLVASALRP
jgi:hypothetical protein